MRTSTIVVILLTLSCSGAQPSDSLPNVDLSVSPLSAENRKPLYARLVAAFDREYERHIQRNERRDFAEDFKVYYLRQELQALIDMWRATDELSYLEQARKLVRNAIIDAKSNLKPLLANGRQRGTWPCFMSEAVAEQTGGHNQINDFQGAAGFLMVANAIEQAGQSGWRDIADFVETSIVEKWLMYPHAVWPSRLKGQDSIRYLLVALHSTRDKREHFATICMDLSALGYDEYPYAQWAQFLTDLYVGIRQELNEPPPKPHQLGHDTPNDWGLIPEEKSGGFTWYYRTSKKDIAILDTSHANRTVWLALKAFHNNMVGRRIVDGLVNTLALQIWKPKQSPFYFANIVDGSDRTVQGMPAGRKGNLWFGWHRLAAYDNELKNLFVSIAYDLTTGGQNIPKGAQNKGMENAPLCFYAWGSRLLSQEGTPKVFP